MQLTKNFGLSEFACKDGTPVPERLIPKTRRLAENLQVIRDYVGDALFINSAYRTPSYNKKIGGVSDSQHPKGTAADLSTRKMTPKQLHALILRLIKEGKIDEGGVGLYPGFVHYDIRGVKARW